MRYAGKTIFIIVAALLLGVMPAAAQKVKKERKAKTEQTQQAEKEAEVKEEDKAEEQTEKADEKKEEKAKKELPAFDENAPMMNPKATPRLYYIRNVNVRGVEHMNENLIRSTSGLIPGDTIYLPSSYISNAITRLWGQRYFSDVKVGATIEGDSVDIELFIKERPRVYNWEFAGEGIGRGKQKDLTDKLKLRRGTELSDYVIDRNERLIKKEFVEKGFRNVEVKTEIENDPKVDNAVNVTFRIDRKERVRVGAITFAGNKEFKEKRLRKAFKKTHQKSINIFQML